MEGKQSFILYNSFYPPIKGLDLETKGRLLDAIFQYHINGTQPEETSPVFMAFMFMKTHFELDLKKWETRCDANRLNGMKGGRPKKPKETQPNPNNPMGLLETQITQPNPTEPKKPEKEKEKEKEKVYENGTDNEKEKKDIPTREEFVNYGISKNKKVDPLHYGLKYDAWIENDWKDGLDNKIIRWKSKLNNTIIHMKETEHKPMIKL